MTQIYLFLTKWEKIGIDLMTLENSDYVVTVDYYSNFWEIDKLSQTTSNTVIKKVKAHMARNGIPNTIITDNGPQFSSDEFKKLHKRMSSTT